MAWTLTPDAAQFLQHAGDLLRSQPVENTVILTAAERVQLNGPSTFGDEPPLFGWWCGADGATAAAFIHTPPFPVGLTPMSAQPAAALADTLADRSRGTAGVIGPQLGAEAFAAAWCARTAQVSSVQRRSRLFQLGSLVPPDPAPPGAARTAGPADRSLVVEWERAFEAEVNDGAVGDPERTVDDRLSYGGVTLWEDSGTPVSLAGVNRPAGGFVRVGPVYTPPRFRRHGYAGAVTSAVTRAALDAGARGVVLFTDLANPTSNALYPRLGYQPVSDRVMLAFSSREPG